MSNLKGDARLRPEARAGLCVPCTLNDNRPTSITHKNSSNSTISSEAYEYDNVGNLTEKTVNSVVTEYGYDDIDQLTSESRSGYYASYTYDTNGNRASKTLNGTTQTYVNDDADKLTSITQGGSTVKSFTYDTAGRTTAVTVSGIDTPGELANDIKHKNRRDPTSLSGPRRPRNR